MAFAVIRSVRLAANTSTGTQDFTVSGIGTPKAAKIIVMSATSTSGASADHRIISCGITDGTFQGGVCAADEDNLATTNSCRCSYDDAVVRIPFADGSGFDAVATFDSFITDGIRINWTNAPAAAVIVHVILWAGTDISAKAGTVLPPSFGSVATNVNVGFSLQHLICISSLGNVDETLGADFNFQISHTVNNSGTPTTFAAYITQRTNFAASEPALVQDFDLCQGIRARSLPFTYFTSTELDPTTPFDSTGFNVISGETAGTGSRLIYLALRYGSKDYALKEEFAPTSTGVKNFTGYGFRPGYALVVPTISKVAWSENGGIDDSQAGCLGLAHWSGVEQWCAIMLSEDAASTTNTNTRTKDKPIFTYLGDNATLRNEANFNGFTSDGFDLDYTTVFVSGALRFIVFALEEEDINGTGAGNFPLAQGAGTGQLIFTGTGAGSFPLAQGAGTGQLIFQATGAGSFPLATGTGAGQEEFSGTGAGNFPLVQGAGTGQEIFTGIGAGTFPLAQGAGTAQLIFQASGAGTFPLATGTGAGLLAFDATGAGNFSIPQGTGAGLLIFTGTGAGNFPLATGTGVGINGYEGTGAGTFPLVQGTGAGQLIFEGQGAGVFPLAQGAGTAELQFSGTGAGNFPLAQGIGAGLLIFQATGAPLFPLPLGNGTGEVSISGSGAGNFPLPQGTGTAQLIFLGSGSGFFPLARGSGSGQNGNMLGCESPMLGSRKVFTDLEGSYALASDLAGSYDQVSDLEGGVC